MKFNPKIVPFDRSAAYMHHRAMKNRRDNNLVDALELLRRAVERSPENREYRLDMAEIYCEMGCHEQSNRLLLDMLAEEDAPAECYYGLALNMLGMNNEGGARNAMRQYLAHEPDGAHSEEVRIMRSELDFFREMRRSKNRRRLRAQYVASQACDHMKDEDFAAARALFEKSLRLRSDQREIRALYAMNLYLMGDVEGAMAQCDQVLEGEYASVRALCVAAQVYQMAGRAEACSALIERALKADPDGVEMRMLIYTMSEIGMHAQAGDLARRALFETPHDRALLHVRAVALLKTGADAQEAAGFWTRILRIDPEDSIAAYYEDLAFHNELEGVELGYAYQVPQAEYERRLKYIAGQIGGGAAAIEREWKENARFRQLLKWCAEIDNPHFQRAAVTVLAAMEDGEAVSTLREYLSRESMPVELKLHASFVLNMRGADMRKLLPAVEDASRGLLPDEESMLEGMPVGQRQLIRYAAETLEDFYDADALAELVLIWQRYRKNRGLRTEPLLRTETAAAALAAWYLIEHGKTPNYARLCREFGCRERQLRYFLARMSDALGEGDTDHDATD